MALTLIILLSGLWISLHVCTTLINYHLQKIGVGSATDKGNQT